MNTERTESAWDRMERVLAFRNCEKWTLKWLRQELRTLTEAQPTESALMLMELAEEAFLWRTITDRIERNIGNDKAFSAGKSNLDALRGGMYPALDALAKARERYKKAMKEFMELAGGNKTSGGLASMMLPILEEAEGVLEDAIEFEARKK